MICTKVSEAIEVLKNFVNEKLLRSLNEQASERRNHNWYYYLFHTLFLCGEFRGDWLRRS